jgi:hypothetical protein
MNHSGVRSKQCEYMCMQLLVTAYHFLLSAVDGMDFFL